MVSKYISSSGHWDLDGLKGVVLDTDLEFIKRIPINRELRDRIIWHFDKTGKNTAKSGYKLFMNRKINTASSSNQSMDSVWNKLWRLRIPNKIKLFCWKVLNNYIPSNVILFRRGIDVLISCPMCENNHESSDHIFFGCDRAKGIWSQLGSEVFLEEDFSDSFVDRWGKISSSC